jgi:hypothetical protein
VDDAVDASSLRAERGCNRFHLAIKGSEGVYEILYLSLLA